MLLAAGGIETLAWVVEHFLPSQVPSSLAPAPGYDDALARRLSDQAQQQGLAIPLVPDDYLGWKLPPSRTEKQGNITVRYNSDGLRGPEISPPTPDTTRIFTLGDSSVFGYGVGEQQIFSDVAARLLSETWGTPVDAVTGAIPGHDSAQSLQVLQRYGARVKPDWVVVGNLWSDLYNHDGKLRATETRVDWARGPLHHLATYRVLVRLLTPWLRTRYVRWMTEASDIGDPTAGRTSRVSLASYAHNLDQIAQVARSLGACTAFVVLPAPLDFDTGAPAETILMYREAMRQVAARWGAPLLDGPAAFHENNASMAYFYDQVHPNTLGHALLGELLSQKLAAHGPCQEPDDARPNP